MHKEILAALDTLEHCAVAYGQVQNEHTERRFIDSRKYFLEKLEQLCVLKSSLPSS